jgi:hypothetical protein
LASAPEAGSFNGRYFESSKHPKDLGPELMDATKQEKTWELADDLVRTAPTASPVEPEPIA